MKFDFNNKEYHFFIDNCQFTDEELKIMDLRRRGWEISRIAAELYLSERTINRRISSISKKIIKII